MAKRSESTEGWIRRDAARVWHGFTQMATYPDNRPLIIERGEGHYLIDTEGRRYLDAISSLWVSTLGHRVPELDDAARRQLDLIAHSTMLGNGNRTTIELAEKLAPLVPVDDPHFLFASDGAAAVEQALKIALQYWINLGVADKTRYLTLGDAYHGDTVGSMSVGADGFGSSIFDPLRFQVVRSPGYDDPRAIERAADIVRARTDELAAVVLEPLVQGAAGIKIFPADRFTPLQEACDETGVLLICDEVATGFGRTGTMFASERCGLTPDLLCLGKGLAAGYVPMSATAASQRVYDAFLGADLGPETLYHGHSFGGNALAAAIAIRHLELFDRWNVLDNVERRAEQLAASLSSRVVPLDAVKEVRQQGLMCGVELIPGDRNGRRVCAASVERGVLLRPLGDVVVIMPPLTITEDEIELIVDTLAASIAEVAD
ncbi:MAG: adenosylmethionine--8-amino-7-oxononanoate transaminase [Actinomycetota bacterium]